MLSITADDGAGTGETGSTRLRPREVQIWSVWLTASKATLARYQSFLSSEEQNRTEQFRFEQLRRSHTLARGVLRLLLAYYLERRPCEIEFAYGLKGKPAILGASRVRFNASHSADMAVYAFTLDCELGIDVEKIRELSDLASISSRFFCTAEASELLSLSPDDRRPAFFRCWTRKEAYVKAVGHGLSVPLDRFQVTLLPEDLVRIVHIESEKKAAQNWALHHFDFAPQYVGALAYYDKPRTIKLRAPVRAEDLPMMLKDLVESAAGSEPMATRE